MKKENILFPIVMFLLISLACNVPLFNNSPDATQVAAEIYATQTAQVPTATRMPTKTPFPTPTPTPALSERLVGHQCITKYDRIDTHDEESTVSETYRLETVIEALDGENILVEVSYRNSNGSFEDSQAWQYSRNLRTGAVTVISEHGSTSLEEEVLVEASDTELQFSFSYTYSNEEWQFDRNGTVVRDPDSYLIRSFMLQEEIYDAEGNYWGTGQDEMTLVSCSSQPVMDINVDGSGVYASLEEAIQAVSADTTLWLSAGTFELDKTLLIDKPIHIFGSGSELTSITSAMPENGVLRFEGPGSFSLVDITLEYAGTGASHVLTIQDGTGIDIQNSKFLGAVRDEDRNYGGSGILLLGDTTGLLKGNELFENELHGIMVKDQSQVTIDLNYTHQNGQTGIVLFDDSQGVVSRSSTEFNGLHGISATENAHVEIIDNFSRENEQVGIYIYGNATGEIRNNASQGNGRYGIALGDRGYAEIYNNTLTDNGRSGMRFVENSGGIVEDNTIAYNSLHGIHLKDQTEARIENNYLYENGEVGIFFSDSAAGVVISNEVYNNKWGVYIEEDTSPEFANNVIYDNSSENIHDDR